MERGKKKKKALYDTHTHRALSSDLYTLSCSKILGFLTYFDLIFHLCVTKSGNKDNKVCVVSSDAAYF